jgi:lysophospholipase L1-like esterase
MSIQHYLALGDSYTIGEQAPIHENFPYQTIQLLRKAGLKIAAPEIVAKTGWTTDELSQGIDSQKLLPQYDWVSLLIGVNNQYRNRTVENYKPEFSTLLDRAIQFSGNRNERVFVLSIPDWGVTPFAEGRDRSAIAKAIDAYNAAAEEICASNQICFIDITELQRSHGADLEYLTEDKLHHSGKEHQGWAEKLTASILSVHNG